MAFGRDQVSEHMESGVAAQMRALLVVLLLAAFLAVPAGYALSRWRFRGKTILEGLLAIPVLMSPMALGVSLLLVGYSKQARFHDRHLPVMLAASPGGLALAW